MKEKKWQTIFTRSQIKLFLYRCKYKLDPKTLSCISSCSNLFKSPALKTNSCRYNSCLVPGSRPCSWILIISFVQISIICSWTISGCRMDVLDQIQRVMFWTNFREIDGFKSIQAQLTKESMNEFVCQQFLIY